MILMDKEYIDPGIPRKKVIIESTVSVIQDVVLPSFVEVNESGICNRKCAFCPKSDPAYPNEKVFISSEIIDKLSHELGELSYSGIFVFSGFGEPLLDKNIYSLIALARRNLEKAKIEVITNGDFLNSERMKKLFESGLSTLVISAYDNEEQVSYFQRMAAGANIPDDKLVIRPRFHPEGEDFGIVLNNRAGMMSNAEFSIPALTEPLVKRCNYPFYGFFVDYTGEVLLCAHDWGKNIIIGDITKQGFLEIWDGPNINRIREELYRKNRDFKPCSACDVGGTMMGGTHVKRWLSRKARQYK